MEQVLGGNVILTSSGKLRARSAKDLAVVSGGSRPGHRSFAVGKDDRLVKDLVRSVSVEGNRSLYTKNRVSLVIKTQFLPYR